MKNQQNALCTITHGSQLDYIYNNFFYSLILALLGHMKDQKVQDLTKMIRSTFLLCGHPDWAYTKQFKFFLPMYRIYITTPSAMRPADTQHHLLGN